MSRATIATLALGAAMLFPNWAAAHVLSIDDISPLHQVDDARVREVLPQTHECIQVPVTFRTQSMTQAQMEEGCGILKEVDDRFHAKLRTSPDNPVEGDQSDRVEAVVFNSYENYLRYTVELFGFIRPPTGTGGQYAEGDSHNPNNTARIFVYLRVDVTRLRLGFSLEHEYVHYLDGRYIKAGNYSILWWSEGLAEYVGLGDVVNDSAIKLIGEGSELPDLDSIHRTSYGANPVERIYGWPYLAVRFLFEEHFDIVLRIKEFFRSGAYWGIEGYSGYFDASIQPLTDRFQSWLREFVPITVRQIEPVTIFQDEVTGAFIDFLDHFLTSQELIFGVAIFLDGMELQFVDRYYLRSEILNASLVNTETGLFIWPNATGTVEVTVTATTRDGESAEQTFTVTVVEALQTKDITVRDPVSTEEGETAINLASYFTGPALSEVEFTVASNDTDVARVAVRDGRLVITAVAAGEAEVTVRTDYYGRQTTQTFTVTITDDCPAYLCRGFFNGWRWLLLEGGQAAATETTPTE